MEAEATGPPLPPTRFLVVADDPDMRAVFRSLIEVEPDMEIVGEADSEGAAIDSVSRFAPDVVVLDAELAEMNGIELVRRYGVDRFPATVFVVGDEREVAAAFQVNAVDCLVKPFSEQRFGVALDRVRRHLRRDDFRDLSSAGGLLVDTREVRNYPQRLWIRSRGQSRGHVIVVKVDDIDWIEAQRKYSCAHTRKGSHNARESISQIESHLDPSRFLRVHRSAIVNLDRVAEVTSAKASQALVLHDGTRVPISRSGKRRLLALANERA